jgi:hypothetical protein
LQIKAVARIAEAGAYFFRRLHHQTHLLDADTARLQPLDLAALLSTVERNRTEKALFLGAKEPGACRLVAYRLPEPIVQERRRIATKKAQQKGDTPSNAHRSRLAWTLLITKVPCTIGQPETIGQVSPLRWHIERIFKAWKSSRPVASIKTKTAAPP